MQVRGPVQASRCLVWELVFCKCEFWRPRGRHCRWNISEVAKRDRGIRRWCALRGEKRGDIKLIQSFVAESKTASSPAVLAAIPGVDEVTATLCIVRRVPKTLLRGFYSDVIIAHRSENLLTRHCCSAAKSTAGFVAFAEQDPRM